MTTSNIYQDYLPIGNVRSWSNLHREATSLFEDLYGASALLTTSGMHALDLVKEHYKSRKWVYSNDLYCDTFNLFGPQDVPVFIESESDIFKNLSEDCVLFFETVSNPHSFVFNWGLVPKIKKRYPDIIIIVDNTWISGIAFNPLVSGADVVVESTSKFYSNGRHIGGVIVSNPLTIRNLYLKVQHIHISPVNLRILIEEFKTLKGRVIAAAKNALCVYEYLVKDSHTIRYPIINPNYPSPIPPSIMLVYVSDLRRLKGLKQETSYGVSYTRFSIETTDDTGGGWLRIAVGYADNPETITVPFMKKRN